MADDTNTMIDIQMEMRAKETIQIGQDLTPPLPPLSFSLYDSSLSSHCSSCFHSLSTTTTTFLHYCSNGGCSAIDAPLHFSSAEHHLFLLLRSRPSLFPHPDSSDLRASLRLLHRFPSLSPPLSPRLFGLLSNRHKLLADDESFARVRDGARAMAMARAMRDGREFNGGDCDCELEEVVLCLVITNAVEVNVDGERPIGIGVYDWRFSWINHSCSPNSCYRFVAAFKEVPMGADSTPSMRIVACGDEVAEIDDTVACSPLELVKAHGNYGLRIIIRSIKGIQSGEEVTITYTDLLQPTALRRSDLLLKYQFICNCKRCCAEPQTYVDLALQEAFFSHLHNNWPRSLDERFKAEVLEKMREVFDSTVMEYMEVSDPVSCCEKIEGLISQGLFNEHLEQTRRVSHVNFRLSPLHHLCLNIYTTLHFTYKIRARERNDRNRLHSFDMSRISAGYSLLLASATHHLFLSERSLIASAAVFWMNAGDSLLQLAKSSLWNLFTSCNLENLSPIANFKCSRCLLMDKIESNFSSTQTLNMEFDNLSRDFLICTSILTPRVWRFLVRGCQYLEDIKDPVDFTWLESLRTSDMWDFHAQSHKYRFYLCNVGEPGGKLEKCDKEEPTNETRSSIFLLGVHCLLYGGYLSYTCYGRHQYRSYRIENVLSC